MKKMQTIIIVKAIGWFGFSATTVVRVHSFNLIETIFLGILC